MIGEDGERKVLERIEELEEKAERQEHELKETLDELKHEIEDLKEEEAHHGKPFLVKVNNKDVPLIGHEHTGLQIKQAAIGAGVRIELDFVLSEELSHGRSRIVGDDQRIRVEEGACFEAIPNDDHS